MGIFTSMDGESILYILIAIVYFVVSAIGSRNKAKKKKAQQEAAKRKADARKQGRREEQREEEEFHPPVAGEDEYEEQPTFQDVFEELFGEGKRTPSKPVFTPEPEQAPLSESEEKLSRMQALEKQRNDRRELTRKQNELAEKFRRNAGLERQKKRGRRIKGSEHLYQNLTLKDAVIAKVILDRPYK